MTVKLDMQAQREFVAEGISKVHVQKAEKEEDCWRYMLRWRRLAHVNTQVTVLGSLLDDHLLGQCKFCTLLLLPSTPCKVGLEHAVMPATWQCQQGSCFPASLNAPA